MPGHAFDITSTPHDDWVEGDEPYVSLHVLSPSAMKTSQKPESMPTKIAVTIRRRTPNSVARPDRSPAALARRLVTWFDDCFLDVS